MYSSKEGYSFKGNEIINFDFCQDVDDAFMQIYKVWQKLDLAQKHDVINEVKLRYFHTESTSNNNLESYNMNDFGGRRTSRKSQNIFDDVTVSKKFLNDSQNALASLM